METDSELAAEAVAAWVRAAAAASLCADQLRTAEIALRKTSPQTSPAGSLPVPRTGHAALRSLSTALEDCQQSYKKQILALQLLGINPVASECNEDGQLQAQGIAFPASLSPQNAPTASPPLSPAARRLEVQLEAMAAPVPYSPLLQDTAEALPHRTAETVMDEPPRAVVVHVRRCVTFTDVHGDLVRLDMRHGDLVWSMQQPGSVEAPTVLHRGALLWDRVAGMLRAFDNTVGEWRCSPDTAGRAAIERDCIFADPTAPLQQEQQDPRSPGNKVPRHLVRRLANFYEYYDPKKLPSVVPTLLRYSGHEEALFAALVSQHGPEPSPDPLDQLPPGWEEVRDKRGNLWYRGFDGTKRWRRPRQQCHKWEAVNL